MIKQQKLLALSLTLFLVACGGGQQPQVIVRTPVETRTVPDETQVVEAPADDDVAVPANPYADQREVTVALMLPLTRAG